VTRLDAAETRRFDELKRRRDQQAQELGIEAGLIASRGTLEMLARDQADHQKNLLPWQRQLLSL
jgi:hypothetical protein